MINIPGTLRMLELGKQGADSLQIKFFVRTLELGKQGPDSLQIKFIGTVLACRCATSCHLPIRPHRHAHGHNKDSWKLADAGIHQPWVDSRSLEPSWPVDVQPHVICLSAHIGMPMGITRTPGNLRMPELTNHGCIHSKSSSLELSWPVDVRNHVHLPYGGMPIISTLRMEPYPVIGGGFLTSVLSDF